MRSLTLELAIPREEDYCANYLPQGGKGGGG